ncbi:MAG: AAA family ATPase [Moraxellaceae bacterium]|nr:AAA family ATPase [Pseudobdellovibrionaceae bacterium]
MMTKELDKRLGKAIDLATQKKHEFVTLDHILFCLVEAPTITSILEELGTTPTLVKSEIKVFIDKIKSLKADDPMVLDPDWKSDLTVAVHRVFERAANQMQNAGRNEVSEASVFIEMFDESKSNAVFVLNKLGLTQFDVISVVSHSIGSPGVDSTGISSTQKKSAAESSSALEDFCVNLNASVSTDAMDKRNPLIGRADVLEKMIQTLARKQKNNPLLIGESGVGKTAIAEGLAEKIVKGEVPDFLKNSVIYSLDLGSLLAGARYRGDFEGRLKKVLKEAAADKNIILFIDEIHNIVGAGATSGGSMDAGNLLKPALSRSEITCIGATTFTEYRQYFEKDRALNRRFQKIDINEPNREDCLKILIGLKEKYEKFHQVTYSDDAVQACVDLSIKYNPQGKLPDKAIDLMDEVGSYKKLLILSDPAVRIVEVDDVSYIISKQSGVPTTQISTSDLSQLKDLDVKLKSIIFGQDEAIEALVKSIKFARSGLENKDKPWGSFLFAGPTGVGKTEVCKQVSRLLGITFHRFDMSEYMEKHSVSRLIGAPPGYVGFDQGGQLSEAVTKTPFSLILLDEIEKAHPDIFNILLQVMDAGTMTDSQGRKVDFKNCLIVMTSNAGAADVAKGLIGFGDKNDKKTVSAEAIKKTFAPEFLNRLDHVIYFNTLSFDLIKQVVIKFLNELKIQLALKKINFSYSDALVEFLAKTGYDPAYGARPLARTIDKHVKSILVDELLFGKLKNGGDLHVDYINQKIQTQMTASPEIKAVAKKKKESSDA